MRRRYIAAGVGLLFGLILPAIVFAQNDVPDCISVRGEARWGADAYNHVVVIQNGCDRAATCQVATNVNPDAVPVAVSAGETVEVLTFRGSPARTFTPRVHCELSR